MKKTPIQQLIEKRTKDKCNAVLINPIIYDAFIDGAKELLETEKQIIQDAYLNGQLSIAQIYLDEIINASPTNPLKGQGLSIDINTLKNNTL